MVTKNGNIYLVYSHLHINIDSDLINLKEMNDYLIKHTMKSDKSNTAVQTDIEGILKAEFSIFNKERNKDLNEGILFIQTFI